MSIESTLEEWAENKRKLAEHFLEMHPNLPSPDYKPDNKEHNRDDEYFAFHMKKFLREYEEWKQTSMEEWEERRNSEGDICIMCDGTGTHLEGSYELGLVDAPCRYCHHGRVNTHQFREQHVPYLPSDIWFT